MVHGLEVDKSLDGGESWAKLVFRVFDNKLIDLQHVSLEAETNDKSMLKNCFKLGTEILGIPQREKIDNVTVARVTELKD